MYIWNKVLLGLIALVSLAFFFFAARALKTHQAWQASVDKQTVALEQVAKDKESLGASIDDLKVTVHRYTFDRGRVWFNTKPQQLNPTTGEVAVAITLPPPPVNSPLFAFEDPTPQNPSGVYMGEFTVKSVDRQQMQLAPTWALTDQRKARLQQSQGMWSLYEIMPKPMPIPTLFDKSSPGAEPSAQAASGEAAAEPSPSDAKRVAPDKPAILSLADFRGVFTEYYRGRAELLDFLRRPRQRPCLADRLQCAGAAARGSTHQGDRRSEDRVERRADHAGRRFLASQGGGREAERDPGRRGGNAESQ